jgi:hypothetical protein
MDTISFLFDSSAETGSLNKAANSKAFAGSSWLMRNCSGLRSGFFKPRSPTRHLPLCVAARRSRLSFGGSWTLFARHVVEPRVAQERCERRAIAAHDHAARYPTPDSMATAQDLPFWRSFPVDTLDCHTIIGR